MIGVLLLPWNLVRTVAAVAYWIGKALIVGGEEDPFAQPYGDL